MWIIGLRQALQEIKLKLKEKYNFLLLSSIKYRQRLIRFYLSYFVLVLTNTCTRHFYKHVVILEPSHET